MLHPEAKITLTPAELAELIPAAQKQDQMATQKLCRAFVTLIYSLVSADEIYNRLGQDAVNIAWEEFLKLVHRYHDNRYDLFPGLVRLLIRLRLLQQLQQEENSSMQTGSLDEDLSQGLEISDEHDPYAPFLEATSFQEIIAALPPRQKQIIHDTFFLGLSLKEQAQLHHSNYDNLSKQYRKALKRLQKLLSPPP